MIELGRCLHGSKLYGLDSSESDTDVKSFHLPSVNECLLIRAKINTQLKDPANDTEYESFALQEFLKHCAHGEGYAMDMLHARGSAIIVDSPLYSKLRANRSDFYTKDMSGLLGYCKTQATKYAFRAERLNAAKSVLRVLQNAQTKGAQKLIEVWDDLPDGPHIVRGTEDRNNHTDKRFYEIAGRKLQTTIAVYYAIDIVENLINSFGERVQRASELDLKDRKSLSHSFRVGYALYHIYKDGDFQYPLPETELIKGIKFNLLDYEVDKLDEKLDTLVSEVENLAAASKYPSKVERSYLDGIILETYKNLDQ